MKRSSRVTIFALLFISLFGIILFIYVNSNKEKEQEKNGYMPTILFEKDDLANPYSPPLKDDRYMVPINVSTNIGAVDTSYRQVGIITPLNGTSKDNILPLMGRPLFTNRGKWQYYTISNQHNNVKLPISFKGKSALNDYGVDEIYNGDTVYVEGYDDAFKVNVYETSTIKYLPIA
jgi:hypothetical protein